MANSLNTKIKTFLHIPSPMPKYCFKSVLDIKSEDLIKMGALAVALDIDNTICNDGKNNCIEGLNEWLCEIQNSGIKIMIISNAIGKRPKKIAKSLNLPCLCFARKPFPHKLYKAAKLMDVNINQLAMIGDQLFADIKAANWCGAIPVRVDPLEGETRWKKYYEIRRGKENPVMEEFKKNHAYGVYDE